MRARHRQLQSEDLIGYDSFLDVVSNLVGILVILITVIGIRTRDASLTAAVDASELPSSEAPRTIATNLEQDIANIREEIDRIKLATHVHRQDRDAMLARIEFVRQALLREQSGLTQQDQQNLRLLQTVESQRDRLTDLSTELQSLQNQDPAPQTLIHDATPIAETVYGAEQHLRLLGGRLDYVPLNEFVGRLKEDAARNAWRAQESEEMTQTLGPIDGFLMEYTLTLQESPIMTPQGPAIQRMVALDRFVLIPVEGHAGPMLRDELKDGSEFSERLRGFEPGTTITVWTYPDSYAEFRELRDWLAKRGFRAAARPLPEGEPIAGSPRGSRSSAQ